MNQHWILKDKNGNPPSPDDYDKYMRTLRKFNRGLLFPCPRSPDDLEMPKKDSSEAAPREMNSFIIFRRQLAYVFKQRKLSDDGKVLSRAASYIWNGASLSERQSYVQMAEELKRRHLARYPDYTYERRKRKTAEEDFVYVNTDSFRETKKKKKAHTPQTSAESNPLNENGAPASTSPIAEHENEWLYNSFTTLTSENSWTNCDNTSLIPPQIQQSYDSECTYPEDSRDPCYTICDVNIPLVTNSILSQNYTDVNTLQQLQQQLSQQLPPSPYYFGDYLIGGGISQSLDALLAPEKQFD